MRFLNTNLVKRTVFALLILALVIPVFALTYYGNYPGRLIGLIAYVLLGVLGVYELTFAFIRKSWVAIVFALSLVLPGVLLPYWEFEHTLRLGSNYSNLLDNLKISFSWQTWLVPIFALLVFWLCAQRQLQLKTLPVLSLFLLGISYMVLLIIKGAWVLNIYAWDKLVFVVSIAVVSDTFGYLGGTWFGQKWFGGKKLAPTISPQKTWAGAVCSWVVASLFTGIVGYFCHIWPVASEYQVWFSIMMALIVPIIAQLGDLFFSALKRSLKLKDFSNLLPMHGGIFDRIDAISVTLFFVIVIFMLT
ncbi:phosphatidate cytidylyltransferase [Mycoplasma sp. ATU-Cv-508]|uniref:phosphatidate cytidylyltransferase n=1 Tax=Mycoplasma sp. ATU-Cv-508 TaxID=2048001 RepID=UPI000FDF5416